MTNTPPNAGNTMPDAGELLPCPFCGGEASAEGRTRYNRPLADTWWEDGSEITECFFVNCIKCGISNGRAGIVGGYQTRAEAIAAWNTRAYTDLLTELEYAVKLLAPFGETAQVQRMRQVVAKARGE